VKAGLSPFAGYMAAWNTSFYTIVILGTQGPMMVNSVAYVAGPRGAWMMRSTALIIGFTLLSLLAMFAINVRGFHMGKWVTGGGSALMLFLAALMVYLLARRWMGGASLAHAPFSLAVPAFSILSLNVFTKMSIGGLSGFDNAGVFAGESRAPGRDLPLSVWLSAPAIAAVYILGTGALLAYVPPDQVDLAAPLQQLMRAGFGNTGFGEAATGITITALFLSWFAGGLALMAATARFPMVIGWDGLLPEWWSHLHPNFRTPVKALAVVTATCVFIALLSSWGAGGQEIFQVGIGAGTACLCVMYALLFSVVVFGKLVARSKPGIPIRLAAFSGLAVSLISLPFQIVPLGGVANSAVFALKVGGLALGINALGAWLYWRGSRRAQARDGGTHAPALLAK
jgi:amino acid transporter